MLNIQPQNGQYWRSKITEDVFCITECLTNGFGQRFYLLEANNYCANLLNEQNLITQYEYIPECNSFEHADDIAQLQKTVVVYNKLVNLIKNYYSIAESNSSIAIYSALLDAIKKFEKESTS